MSRMCCDVGDATEGFENEQDRLLQPLPSLHLRHSSHSRIFLSRHLCRRHFTYVVWRAARGLPLVLMGQFLLNYNNFVHSKNTISEHISSLNIYRISLYFIYIS